MGLAMFERILEWTVKLGLPSVLVLFFVYWITGNIDRRLEALEKQHADSNSHSQRVEDLMGQTFHSSEKSLLVLRVTCTNAAKTDDARERCLQ